MSFAICLIRSLFPAQWLSQTMTSAVVSGILKPLGEKLASSAVEELELVCGVKDDREKLKNTLETTQRVLADAEQRQTKDEAVSILAVEA